MVDVKPDRSTHAQSREDFEVRRKEVGTIRDKVRDDALTDILHLLRKSLEMRGQSYREYRLLHPSAEWLGDASRTSSQ